MESKINLLLICLTVLVAACSQETGNEIADSPPYLLSYNVYAPDSTNDDNYEVFVMELDGSNQRNITNHPDVAWSYTAVNDKVLFVSDRDTTSRIVFLHEMNADGSQVKKLANFRLRDSWMSHRNNGKELIVTAHPSLDSAFYIITRSGELLRKTYTGLVNSSDPAFSPDGQQIAFRGGNKKSKREAGYEEAIYLMDLGSEEIKKLTSYPKADTTAPWFAYKAGPPRWHPSGDYISYQSYQNGKYSLFAVSADGSQHWKLTDLSYFEGWHDWSPDGRWLAIEVSDSSREWFGIGLMNWEHKDFKILTDSTRYRYQQAPSFTTKTSD